MSATWYGVAVTVKIDFDSGPWVASGSLSWSDVTNDVRSISTNRGRSSELSAYSPGSVTVTLNNRDRTYDPANTAGTYYGKFKPRRRIQILLGGTAVFTGFVTSWLLEWPEAGLDATTVVTAVDALDVLAGATLPGSAYGAAVLADSPAYYWPMQKVDEGGSPAVAGSLDLSRWPYGGGTLEVIDGTLPIGEPDSLGNSGSMEAATSGNVTAFDCWVTWDGTSPSTAVGSAVIVADGSGTRSIYLDPSAGQIEYKDSTNSKYLDWTDIPELARIAANTPTHVAVTTSNSTVTVYINGISVLAASTSSGATTVFYSGVTVSLSDGNYSVSHLATYASNPSASRILAHYLAGTFPYGHPYGERGGARIGRILDAIGWPSADRTLSTGETVLGNWLPASGDALSACRAVEVADQGMFVAAADGKIKFLSRQDTWTTTRNITAQATFGDDTGETPTEEPLRYDAASLDYTRNVVTVSYDAGSVTIKDATSVTAYGELPDSVNAQLIPANAGYLARQLARFRIRLRATPTARVPQIAIQPHHPTGNASTHVATLVALELGDRVLVKRRPNGSTDPISQQCTVQGIRWTITPSNGFRWVGYLAPAAPSYTEAPYLTVGDATYGKIGASDGNLVPF